MRWTDDQLDAIEHSGRNILVAAAAGSGKTAVLVERVIRKILSGALSLDQLLVLTFTEAAAKEMNRKISDAVSRELQSAVLRHDTKATERLRQQSLLVNSASISTVHSFCSRIIKNNIHLTDLPTDFSIVDEIENEVLRKQALDTVLEEYYARIDQKTGFRDLVIGYGGAKSDAGLRELILSLHSFSKSMAHPAQWLKAAADAYGEVARTGSLTGSRWEAMLLSQYAAAHTALAALFKRQADAAARLAELDPGHKFVQKVTADLQKFQACFDPGCRDLQQVSDALTSYTFERLAGAKKSAEGEVLRLQEEIKSLRAELKDTLVSVKELFGAGPETETARIAKIYPAVRTLKNLVRLTEKRFKAAKREKSLLDFNDLEHEFLKLLSGKHGEPSEVAFKLQATYREILVDEYQDTNQIQETMFRLISGGRDNIFMVGDLKQSIYGFRNASPAIFAEKYKTYTQGGADGGGELIRLFQNFRSREGVINTVNHIFRGIMSDQVGDVDYTEDEFLVRGADYPAAGGLDPYATELLLTCADREDVPAIELEALTIAERIKQLVGGGEMQVTDKGTGQSRKLRYGDIVILLRSQKTAAPILERVLEDHDIPVYTEVGHSYLSSVEVMTVLNFLQVIDNPMQDIPLLALMRSPIFGFCMDELAAIRTRSPKVPFYDAMKIAAGIEPKTAQFLNTLNQFRLEAEYMGIDELIWKICTEYNYFAIAGGMPGGQIRQSNLKLLFERAAEYERSTLSGLFNFMNYIETIREEDKDLSPAKLLGEGDDVVRIMTIHTSKGLEYPVVILADTNKQFNAMDNTKPVLWHEKIGIGMDCVDIEKRIQYPCLTRALVKYEKQHDIKSEEMRLLYVALTRAKEKLILSATYTSKDQKWADCAFDRAGCLSGAAVESRRKYRDWILPMLAQHPDAGALRELGGMEGVFLRQDPGFALEIRLYDHKPEEAAQAESEEPRTAAQAGPEPPLSDEELRSRLNYIYPHDALGQVPVKLSVTELKRREADAVIYTAKLPGAADTSFQSTSDITGAEKGTVTHYVMQHMDFHRADTPMEVNAQIAQMAAAGIISPAQFDAVDQESICQFCASELGRRLKSAIRFEREYDFYMEIPAGALYHGLREDEMDEKILVQGIADCIFEEEDGLVLLDYKTDRVTKETVQKRAEAYRQQLELYTDGINAILTDKKIKERYLYFLSCDTAVNF